jgi:hypothetical protein
MIEFKYIIFVAMFITLVPTASTLIVRFPKLSWFALFTAVFFTANMLDINFVSREIYRGTSRGFEVGMVDIATVVLLIYAISNRDKYKLNPLPRGSLIYFAFFLCCALSIVNSDVKLYSFFELFKMVRIYLFFWTMNNIIVSPKVIKRIVYFFSFVSLYVFLQVLREKYVFGMYQSSGPFPHQNSLVMYMLVLVNIHFSCWMSSKSAREIVYWCFVVAAELFCILSTMSRAGIALAAISITIVMLFHMSWRMNLKKFAVIALLAVMGMAGLAKSLDSIVTRFKTAPEESANTRVRLARAAVKMADDKTLGVGLNNFSLKMSTKYPYSSHIDVKIDPETREEEAGGIVETVYLLIASECGWHTLGIYFFLLLTFYMRNILNIFLTKDVFLKTVCIGLFAGLAAIYIESTLEWVLKQTNNFYQLMLVFAIINAITRLRQHGASLVKPQASIED